MTKDKIVDILRKLSYKNISIDTTEGRNTIADALLNDRDDEWRIDQFNRNRPPEEHISTIEEMNKKISEMYDEVDGYEVGPWKDDDGNVGF